MPRTILKMFDQLVKPIAIYGAEIWGIDLLNCDSTPKLMNSMSKLRSEKLNLPLCRHVLGVHRKAQSSAVTGE